MLAEVNVLCVFIVRNLVFFKIVSSRLVISMQFSFHLHCRCVIIVDHLLHLRLAWNPSKMNRIMRVKYALRKVEVFSLLVWALILLFTLKYRLLRWCFGMEVASRRFFIMVAHVELTRLLWLTRFHLDLLN